ncbi:MAG: GvpL/GvpF family gas vesicle protein [Syntrophobacteraceae bacterium]|jgi:hypothetical protein
MVRQKADHSGKYLYAIIAGKNDRVLGPFGIDGGAVYSVSDGQIAAVISDFDAAKIRPERRHLAAHQEVLKKLMEETTPLPMSFGIIARGLKAIKIILSIHQQAFIEKLNHVAGRVEMGLRVTWDVPNIFEYFVLTHEELRAARDLYLGRNREPSQEDKIEVGRLFDHIINEDREAYADRIEDILSMCCIESKRNTPRNEREVINLACLVERNRLEEFEKGIFEAARLFDNNFAFDYNGPWAPHNFVNVVLNL